ncbi:efflux RND transporter permease subunit, partial [Rhizobium ruizarguesonis]
LVLATGPLGIIGAAAALLISGAPFVFVSILGVIALLGIIMRNSIILVDQIDQDIKAGMIGRKRRTAAPTIASCRCMPAL